MCDQTAAREMLSFWPSRCWIRRAQQREAWREFGQPGSQRNVQGDVRRGRGVSQGAYGNIVYAGLCYIANSVQRDAATGFYLRAPINQSYRLAELIERHVIQQNDVRPRLSSLTRLYRGVRLHFDFKVRASRGIELWLTRFGCCPATPLNGYP